MINERDISSYQNLRERIIEASFYITKYTGEQEFDKVRTYKRELDRLIEEVLKNDIRK